MSKLMILGGSNCQKNALIAAQRRGDSTVLIDYYDNPPAKEYADVHVKASTFDVAACVQAAQLHGVEGIMTLGTDQPVYTAAVVAEKLGLPTAIDSKTALAVTNKQVMKMLLSQHHIPTVNYCFVKQDSVVEDLAKLQLPLVIKPLDSQGQRGIYKLETAKEILEAVPNTLSFSRCDTALVEEFYKSEEVTVSAWVQDANTTILTVTDRLLYDDPVHIGVCIGHRFPSKHMNRYQEFDRFTKEIASVFGIQNGPLYIQFLVGEQGVKVNELACRIGGAFEDVFIPYISGFDILGAVMDTAVGKKPDCTKLHGFDCSKSDRCASVQLLFCNSGKVTEITPLSTVKALPFVADAGYNYAVGDTIPKLENATARFGHGVIFGDSGNIASRIEEFYDKLQVVSERNENLLIRRKWEE